MPTSPGNEPAPEPGGHVPGASGAAGPQDLGLLSDQELQALCAPRGWEEPLERYGCLTSLVLSLTAALAVGLAAGIGLRLGAGGSIALAVLALALAGPATYSSLHRALDRRRLPLRTELRRRFGLDPGRTYVDEERAHLDAPGGPAMALVLSVAALPHGGRRWVRVHVWRDPPRARIDVRLVRWAAGVGDLAGAALLRAEGELPEPLRTELLALLDDPGAAALATVPAQVLDGAPATVTVVERAGVHTGTCNLGDLDLDPDRQAARHPTVRFADLLLRASEAAGAGTGRAISPPAAGTAPRTPPRSDPS